MTSSLRHVMTQHYQFDTVFFNKQCSNATVYIFVYLFLFIYFCLFIFIYFLFIYFILKMAKGNKKPNKSKTKKPKKLKPFERPSEGNPDSAAQTPDVYYNNGPGKREP